MLPLTHRQFGHQADSCDIDEIITEGIDDNAEQLGANWLVVCPGTPAELAAALTIVLEEVLADASLASHSPRVVLAESPEVALEHAALDEVGTPCQIVLLATDASRPDDSADAGTLIQAQELTSVVLVRLVRGLNGKRISA